MQKKMGVYDELKFFGIYQEEFDNILRSFRIMRKITKEDIEKYEVVGFAVDDEVEQNPTPETAEEAFFLLTNYYAAIQCVVCKDRGLKVYRIWNKYSLEEEKYRLKRFIDEANSSLWFPNFNDSPISVFKNLINGYYRNSKLIELPDLENSMPARVYGEYVLYFEWIKAELRKVVNNSDSEDMTTVSTRGYPNAKPLAQDDLITSVIADQAANEKVIKMLYDFEILNRKTKECNLNKKQNGKLYAVIDAIIKEAPHLFATKPGVLESPSGQSLLPYFNSLINRDFKEFDTKNNKNYKLTIKPARDYIKNGFKI